MQPDNKQRPSIDGMSPKPQPTQPQPQPQTSISPKIPSVDASGLPKQIHTPKLPSSNPAEPSMVDTSAIPSNSRADTIKPMPKSSPLSAFKGFISLVELVGGALLLALAINSFVFQSYQVFGMSMSPTLSQDDRLIISKVSRSWASVFSNEYLPERGTVIVFQSPKNSNLQLVKRVIGMPGERVVVSEGEITVYNDENPDGFDPDELFDVDFADFTTGDVDITVAEGQIFVSGDNRTPGGSLDSRNELGTVPLDLIVGSVSARIFPLSSAEFF